MANSMTVSESCQTQYVRIDSIKVLKRIRQSVKGIDTLAEDIKWNGLINPPTVLDNGDETYTLITGLRRLRACQQLDMINIRVTILSAVEADDMLALEFAENEQRQDFTVSERLEYAEKIKEIERRRGRERKALYARNCHGSQENEDVFHGTHPEKGKSRDIIAKKAGFSSGVQYERIAKVADARPDLLEKIDNDELSVRQAYSQAFPAMVTEEQDRNIIRFPSRGIDAGDSRDIDARKAELDAEADADKRAYDLTKAYTNTICAVIQLPTTTDAVHEWIKFARMDRGEIEQTLADVQLAADRMNRLAQTLSECLNPRAMKQ